MVRQCILWCWEVVGLWGRVLAGIYQRPGNLKPSFVSMYTRRTRYGDVGKAGETVGSGKRRPWSAGGDGQRINFRTPKFYGEVVLGITRVMAPDRN